MHGRVRGRRSRGASVRRHRSGLVLIAVLGYLILGGSGLAPSASLGGEVDFRLDAETAKGPDQGIVGPSAGRSHRGGTALDTRRSAYKGSEESEADRASASGMHGPLAGAT